MLPRFSSTDFYTVLAITYDGGWLTDVRLQGCAYICHLTTLPELPLFCVLDWGCWWLVVGWVPCDTDNGGSVSFQAGYGTQTWGVVLTWGVILVDRGCETVRWTV